MCAGDSTAQRLTTLVLLTVGGRAVHLLRRRDRDGRRAGPALPRRVPRGRGGLGPRPPRLLPRRHRPAPRATGAPAGRVRPVAGAEGWPPRTRGSTRDDAFVVCINAGDGPPALDLVAARPRRARRWSRSCLGRVAVGPARRRRRRGGDGRPCRRSAPHPARPLPPASAGTRCADRGARERTSDAAPRCWPAGRRPRPRPSPSPGPRRGLLPAPTPAVRRAATPGRLGGRLPPEPVARRRRPRARPPAARGRRDDQRGGPPPRQPLGPLPLARRRGPRRHEGDPPAPRRRRRPDGRHRPRLGPRTPGRSRSSSRCGSPRPTGPAASTATTTGRRRSPRPPQPNVYYYRFIVRDGPTTRYLEDDVAGDGGAARRTTAGAASVYAESPDSSWQIAAYEPGLHDARTGPTARSSTRSSPTASPTATRPTTRARTATPGTSGAERLPAAGDVYGNPILPKAWTDLPEGYCRAYQGVHVRRAAPLGRDFFGGDLAGITAKLDDLADLGRHRALPQPDLRRAAPTTATTRSTTRTSTRAWGRRPTSTPSSRRRRTQGIRVVLDGVFNHVSSSSPWFDRARLYEAVGACESADSPYRSWFTFRKPDANEPSPCAPTTEGGDDTYYVGWFGFDTIPEIVESAETNALFVGADGVVRRVADRGRRRVAPRRDGQPLRRAWSRPIRDRHEGDRPGRAGPRRAVGGRDPVAPGRPGRLGHELPLPPGGHRPRERRHGRPRRRHRGPDAERLRLPHGERDGAVPAGGLGRAPQPRGQPRHDAHPLDAHAGRGQRGGEDRAGRPRRGQGEAAPGGRAPAHLARAWPRSTTAARWA